MFGVICEIGCIVAVGDGYTMNRSNFPWLKWIVMYVLLIEFSPIIWSWSVG